jgi:hypothetical protein
MNLLPTKIARLVEQAADHSSSGNPEGISKECGKGGKPASWLSTLSILCHFHGLLRKRVSQSRNHREDTFWEQKPLVREADVSEGIAPFVEIPAELRPIPAAHRPGRL